MSINIRSAGFAVALGLIVTVLSQVAYMAFLGGPGGETSADMALYMNERARDIGLIWTTEVVAFSVIAIAALVAAIRGAASPAMWIALAIAGIFNAIQAGIGLSLFKPFAMAGEDFNALLKAIVAGAFFFYFLAKALIGFAAIGFGIDLFKSQSMGVKILAALGILSGLAALVINVMALPQGMKLTLMAGASGTLATLICGLMILVISRAEPES